jgi:long-chain acyl-CoA synthetase
MEDLAVLKPTVFPSVPRIFNRICDKIKATVAAKNGAVQWLFNKGVASKLHYLKNGATYTHRFYDRLFASVRAQLGGNVRIMITGSAPISADVLDYLKVTFGC